MTPAELLAATEAVLRDGFGLMGEEISPALAAAFRARGIEIARVLKAGTAFDVIDRNAVKYAHDRAGELIKDFARTTPDMLRGTIEQALEQGWSIGRLRQELATNYAFEPARALTIARTETRVARRAGGRQTAGDLGASKKEWDIGGGDPCMLCQANAAQGQIEMDEPFVSGDDPHPNCTCDVNYSISDA